MENIEVYKNMLTELIKKQMVMLGPNVALGTARKVQGISVSEDGTVIDITEEPKIVMDGVVNSYMSLSGQITQMALNTILENYPSLKQT